MSRIVVSSAPASTRNMTGFFIIFRGPSLMKESRSARRRIARSNNESFFCRLISGPGTGSRRRGGTSCSGVAAVMSEHLSRVHQELLDVGSQRKNRKVREGAHDQNHGNQKEREQGAVDGEGARRFG